MKYFVLAALFLAIASCNVQHQAMKVTSPAHCQAQEGLPDQHCTPGDTFTNITSTQVCKPGYAQSVRNVPQSEKDQVYSEYGIAQHAPGAYEVDHLISLELGGSNDIKNLWPQPYTGQYNAHMKDQIENYLHNQVCSGKMALKDAQTKIAVNWKQFIVDIQ